MGARGRLGRLQTWLERQGGDGNRPWTRCLRDHGYIMTSDLGAYKNSSELIKHPVLGRIQALQVFLGTARHVVRFPAQTNNGKGSLSCKSMELVGATCAAGVPRSLFRERRLTSCRRISTKYSAAFMHTKLSASAISHLQASLSKANDERRNRDVAVSADSHLKLLLFPVS